MQASVIYPPSGLQSKIKEKKHVWVWGYLKPSPNYVVFEEYAEEISKQCNQFINFCLDKIFHGGQ